MESKGISLVKGAKVNELVLGDVHYIDKSGELNVIEGDVVLVAVGRKPNTENLALEKIGVNLNDKGGIETDHHQRTNIKNIWAAGDVCGKLQFTYISLDDSRIIFSQMHAHGFRTTETRGAFSYSVFLDPPFSSVGMNKKEVEEQGIEYRVVKISAAAVPNAKVMKKTDGFLSAIIDREGYILGAQLFCAESHEMINFIKFAIDNKIHYRAIRDFIFTHPSMLESLNYLFSM